MSHPVVQKYGPPKPKIPDHVLEQAKTIGRDMQKAGVASSPGGEPPRAPDKVEGDKTGGNSAYRARVLPEINKTRGMELTR